MNGWQFLPPDYLSDAGDGPIGFTNVVSAPASFDGNGLQVDAPSNEVAFINYPIKDAMSTNLLFFDSTIEVWVLPDWNSGVGPGGFGRIIDIGQYSTNSPSSWFSLYFSPDGSSINFSSETNGLFTNYFCCSIAFDTNSWHLLDLTWNRDASKLYIDGTLTTNGPGVRYEPSPSAETNGFFIGSAFGGDPATQARAQFDDLATYSYALDAEEITNDYAAGLQTMSGGGTFGDYIPSFPGGGTNGGGTYTSDYLTNSYNFGTNLWIAQVNISSNHLNAIASNTVADVQYEVEYKTNLAATNWLSEGFFLGSETTNWTPLNPMPAAKTNNFFIQLRSWQSSDGSGLPDWWELEYFGYLGVDANALDSAGDGYSIYQKFIMGLNPNVFYMPTAPTGLTATLHQATGSATVTWMRALGSVTGYTVQKMDFNSASYFVTNISVTGTNFSDNLSADMQDPFHGNDYDVTYQVSANYANGSNSAWSSAVPLQQPTVSGGIQPSTNGLTYLAIWDLPANAVTVRVTFIAVDAEWFYGDASENYSNDIPVASFTNGLYALPSSLQPLGNDYYIFVQTVDSEGDVSGAFFADGPNGAVGPAAYNWGAPFYDGRAQLKQNLIFQLRSAPQSAPFDVDVNFVYEGEPGRLAYSAATNYAYAGLYTFGYPVQSSLDYVFDFFQPYKQNYLFRNFVYDVPDSDASGLLLTGVGTDSTLTPYMQLDVTPSYQFQDSFTNDPSVLAINESRWLLYDQQNSGDTVLGGIISGADAASDGTLSMASNVRNWYGLPYVSVEAACASYDDGTLFTNVISAGATATSINFSNAYAIHYYVETAQPNFSTVEYDFWQASAFDALPGDTRFSPTNASRLLICPVADSYFQVAGYAKLAVTNAYSGVYGYLGQYFDKAYLTDTNGEATTNETGILSPYGSFFATRPGQAALVTMPDIDTGERGTCMVYAVSIQLDANHDGIMDTNFSGADTTALNSPYVFWCNNNFDRNEYEADDQQFYDDDVLAAGDFFTPYATVPDYNFKDGAGNRCISCERDLQDFARLWVCGFTTNLLAKLPSGSSVTLSWGDVGSPNPANPTIDLFTAAEADGGIGYLTNSSTAGDQIYNFAYPCIGRLGPGQSIRLNASTFTGSWAGNHFIWCGVSNGTGGLTLTIADGNGNQLAQTTAYIQIKDIKQMYERWTVGDIAGSTPLANAILASDNAPALIQGFSYPPPQSTNVPYILCVHGWNMESWLKDRFGECAYKRLYWLGYQGRFGFFRWPTGNGFTGSILDLLTDRRNYDNSEYTAWQTGESLLNKLNDLNIEYPGHVYLLAHSMGNVVAGEALRLSGGYQVVNSYVASQGAVPAHTYDDTLPDSLFTSGSPATPNIYKDWFAANNGGGAGHIFNFYNTNDFALQSSRWELNQELKPDNSLTVFGGIYLFDGYPYGGVQHYTPGSVDDISPWNYFAEDLFSGTHLFNLNLVSDRYQVSAYAAQARSSAFGRTANVNNVFLNVFLGRTTTPLIWPADPSGHAYGDHYWHSAEFRGDNWQQQGYWNELLGPEVFNLK